MNKNVYIVTRNSVYDYEENEEEINVFENFKNALDYFNKEKKDIKFCMKEDFEDNELSIEEKEYNNKEENLYFGICEDGDYTRNHDNLLLQIKKLQ